MVRFKNIKALQKKQKLLGNRILIRKDTEAKNIQNSNTKSISPLADDDVQGDQVSSASKTPSSIQTPPNSQPTSVKKTPESPQPTSVKKNPEILNRLLNKLLKALNLHLLNKLLKASTNSC